MVLLMDLLFFKIAIAQGINKEILISKQSILSLDPEIRQKTMRRRSKKATGKREYSANYNYFYPSKGLFSKFLKFKACIILLLNSQFPGMPSVLSKNDKNCQAKE